MTTNSPNVKHRLSSLGQRAQARGLRSVVKTHPNAHCLEDGCLWLKFGEDALQAGLDHAATTKHRVYIMPQGSFYLEPAS